MRGPFLRNALYINLLPSTLRGKRKMDGGEKRRGLLMAPILYNFAVVIGKTV